MDQGLDEETERLYSTGNQTAILGGDSFVQLVKSEHEVHKQLIDQNQGNYPSINTIIEAVANEFCMEVKELTKSRQGRGSENIPRWVALYLCRELSQTTF
jgi:putative transposase